MLEPASADKQFLLVDANEGVPKVRWKVLAIFVVMIVLAYVLMAYVVTLLSGLNIGLPIVVIQSSALMTCMVIAIELQRQRIINRKWKFRFSVASILWMTVSLAVFFGALAHQIRTTQQNLSQSRIVITKLKPDVGGDTARAQRGAL